MHSDNRPIRGVRRTWQYNMYGGAMGGRKAPNSQLTPQVTCPLTGRSIYDGMVRNRQCLTDEQPEACQLAVSYHRYRALWG